MALFRRSVGLPAPPLFDGFCCLDCYIEGEEGQRDTGSRPLHSCSPPPNRTSLSPLAAMLRGPRILVVFLALHLLSLANAFPLVESEADSHALPLQQRATTDFIAPTGYKVSWNVAGKRASTGASTGGLGYTFIAKTGAITQTLVNTCATKCKTTAKCGMYQIIQLSGAAGGSVVCDLHSEYVSSKKATYTSGLGAAPAGKVVTAYGIRSLSTPVSGSGGGSTTTQKVTSTITKGTTTSTTTSVATVAFPASPPGATLVQFAPCSSVTKNTVPMFVNNQYVKSTETSAYIVQHGSGLNFQDYFTSAYAVVGTKGIIAAPNFYYSTSAVAPNTWYQPAHNLAWNNATGTWAAGTDAVAPSAVACSSFDVYDALIAYFSNKTLFPELTKIYFVSHSAGANMVSRYSQLYNGASSLTFRYIVANAASQAYFDNPRPETVTNCPSAYTYPSELVSSGMPRYVAARFTTASAIFQRWITRDVVTLVGTYDTLARYPGGVEDCASQAQGGINRRDRNYAWWAYTNILAATGANVTAYTGYQQLLKSGAKTLYKGTFNHQNCVVDQVGHDQTAMFASACGVAAMTTAKLPAGVGANYDGGS